MRVTTLLPLILACNLEAQVVTGRVRDRTLADPVGSGFVVLLDPAGGEVARTLASSDGRFSLEAPGSGTYRLRSERIGYRPSVSEPFALATGETLERTLTVDAIPVQLDAVVVAEDDRCRISPAEAEATSAVWEEIRKALAAAAWTSRQHVYRYVRHRYERRLDANGRRLGEEWSETASGHGAAPFASLAARDLVRDGFIVERSDGVWYYAPDANVLHDPAFLDTHCFRVRTGEREGRRVLGLAFEPAPGRALPDVRGVLWVDARTAALRLMEFHYTAIPHGIRDDRAGGIVEFLGLPTGEWIVRRWRIRAPLAAVRTAPAPDGRRVVLRGFQDIGGEVLEARGPLGDVIFEGGYSTLRGTVSGASGRGLGGALVAVVGAPHQTVTDSAGRFELRAPLAGEYRITFDHPSLDSLGFRSTPRVVALAPNETTEIALAAPPVEDIVRTICPATADPDTAVIVGTLRDVTGQPVSGDTLIARWEAFDGQAGRVVVRPVQLRVAADPAGRYLICGVPVDRTITLVTSGQGTAADSAVVRFEPGAPWRVRHNGRTHEARGPIWRVDLVIP